MAAVDAHEFRRYGETEPGTVGPDTTREWFEEMFARLGGRPGPLSDMSIWT